MTATQQPKLPIALTDLDRRIFEEEIDPVLPRKIFDIHTHVYLNEHIGPESPERGSIVFDRLYPSAGWDDCDAADRLLLPGREVHRVAFGFPFQDVDFKAINEFTITQSRKDPQSGAFLLVKPAMSAEDVERQIVEDGFLGLKPYRLYTTTGDPKESRITNFLPEHQLEVADRYGLGIILQLSKSGGIADADNISDLERLSERYARVRFIMAHCARAFYPQPLDRVGKRLARLRNVYFDSAAVCEYGSYDRLLELVGPGRIMYGSDDLPACVDRGKYISWGEAWMHGNEDSLLCAELPHCDSRMTFIRYEVLRALARAIRRHALSSAETAAIFNDTAAGLVTEFRAAVRDAGHRAVSMVPYQSFQLRE